MSYRIRPVTMLAALVFVLLAWTTASANLSGNTFTSRSHLVSLTRPDASWQLRENPAQKNAVALFSNGEGRVITLLAHETIAKSDAIDSPGNLRSRWNTLAREIVAMTGTGETDLALAENDYQATDQGVRFEIMYTNHSRALGTNLQNWITGQIVRGSDGRQHIYAVRCAAPSSSFEFWESQFAMFMPTLRYEGTRQTPFYTNPPIPRWWFILGGAVMILVIFLLGRRRGSQRVVITEERLQSQPARRAAVVPAAQQSQSPESPDQSDDGIPNVPDSMLVAADLSDVPDQAFRDAAVDGQTYDDSASTSQPGFWKCSCGRMNALDEEFCVRCNADREPANRKSIL